MGATRKACPSSGVSCTWCHHHKRCRRIEPTGEPLPCELLLVWEANGQPAPDRHRQTSRPSRRTEKLIAEKWPSKNKSITIAEFAAALGTVDSTARRHLERAVELGIVCRAGRRGKATLYARNGDLARSHGSTKMRGKKG